MKEFNSLNGYEVADKTAREEIETIKSDLAQTKNNLCHGRTKGTYNQTAFGVNGYVTAGGKEAVLFIPMTFKEEVETIVLNSISCSIRTSAGGYFGGATGVDLTEYITGCDVAVRQGMIRVTLNNPNGWGITNNSVLCGLASINYTLS